MTDNKFNVYTLFYIINNDYFNIGEHDNLINIMVFVRKMIFVVK